MNTEAENNDSGLEQRKKLSQIARRQGEQRTREVIIRVRDTMRLIEQEMSANAGQYPGNNGRLSKNELARRARVHHTTLHGSQYLDLLDEVKRWIAGSGTALAHGRATGRKSLATRVSEWRTLYENVCQSERDTNLALQQKEAELDALRDELGALQRQHVLMNTGHEAAGTNVVVLHQREDHVD